MARTSFREGFHVSYKSTLSSRKFYSSTEPDASAIFGPSKKVDNQIAASQTEKTDVGLGAADDASHTIEPLRVVACGGTVLSEPWALKQF